MSQPRNHFSRKNPALITPEPEQTLQVNPAVAEDASVAEDMTEIQISPTRLVRQLLATIAVLILLSTLGQISRHVFQRGSLLGLVDLFYVDTEANIPTAYSALIWLCCSLTAAAIAMTQQQRGDRLAKHWRGLALVFAYVALDEAAKIHELFLQLDKIMDVGGVFHFAWIIPGSIFFVIFAINSLKLLKKLPTKTRHLLILAGGIFVTGALGVEMIGAWHTDRFGFQADLTYAIVATIEETLEMLGVLILLYALLSYWGSLTRPIKIKVVR
jgi:hypothetical protein